MIYNEVNKTSAYIELTAENGNKMIMPTNSVIMVDDNSNLITVKNTASRKASALLMKGSDDL